MLKTARSAEMMLAEPYCFLSSAGFFQQAFAASEYHASKCPFTTFWSLPSTLFLTKPFNVLRAMILTAHHDTLLPLWEQELYRPRTQGSRCSVDYSVCSLKETSLGQTPQKNPD